MAISLKGKAAELLSKLKKKPELQSIAVINPAPQPIDSPKVATNPWDDPPDTGESTIAALEDLWEERRDGPLYLVSRETKRCYHVLEYDGETKRCVAELPDASKFTVILGGREAAKYYPYWGPVKPV